MMFTCPQDELYSAFVDNEINSPWKEKIQTHIDSCESCKKKLKKYEQLSFIVHNDAHFLNADKLSQSYMSLQKKIHHISYKNNNKLTINKLRIPAIAAVLLAAIVIPVTYMNSHQQETIETPSHISLTSNNYFIRNGVISSNEELKEAAIAAFRRDNSYQRNHSLQNVSFPSVEICPPQFTSNAEKLIIKLPEATEIFFSSQENTYYKAVLQ